MHDFVRDFRLVPVFYFVYSVCERLRSVLREYVYRMREKYGTFVELRRYEVHGDRRVCDASRLIRFKYRLMRFYAVEILAAEFRKRRRVDIERGARVKSDGKLEPAGECGEIRACLSNYLLIVLGVVRTCEMYERNAEPVGALMHAAVRVVTDDADNLGIEPPILGTCYEILKARTASVLGA